MGSVQLLPGDRLPNEQLQNTRSHSKTLTVGPGLHYDAPDVTATAVGTLSIDQRKNAVWLETNAKGHYIPSIGDNILAIVRSSSTDYWHCEISPFSASATLPQLAFENATKKTRPMLQRGSLVYARISLANRDMDPELECVHPSTGKADGLGELKGGMVFDISLGLARRMLMAKPLDDGGVAILDELGGKGVRFEIAVGANGRIWINSEGVKTTLAVGRAIQRTDSENFTVEEQVKLAKRIAKELS